MAIAPHGSFLGVLDEGHPLGLEHFGSGEDVITPECDGLKLANAFLVPFGGVQGKAGLRACGGRLLRSLVPAKHSSRLYLEWITAHLFPAFALSDRRTDAWLGFRALLSDVAVFTHSGARGRCPP